MKVFFFVREGGDATVIRMKVFLYLGSTGFKSPSVGRGCWACQDMKLGKLYPLL